MSEIITQAAELSLQNARRMADQLERMAALVISLDARLRQVEKLAAQKVTIDSGQYKQLLSLIRDRASRVAVGHGVADPRAEAAFRRDIKKEIQAAYGIRDLHDLPVREWERVTAMVAGWYKYSLVKKWKYEEAKACSQ